MIDPFKLSALSRHAVGLWHEFKGLLLFLFLMVIFRSAVADWSDVPTGSMKPTIIEGDRIFVNKMAYDLRVPLTVRAAPGQACHRCAGRCGAGARRCGLREQRAAGL